MPVEIAGFAQAFARYLDLDAVDPRDLEKAQSDANESFELRFVEPSADEPLIRSGSAFSHLLFVHRGTIVPWQYPYSELGAPFLVGEHEFLSKSDRWVASYSLVTEAVVVDIPIDVMANVQERIPGARDRMYSLVLQRGEHSYWSSLAASGTSASRVAAALVSQLVFRGDDHGEGKRIKIPQRDLARLTTMSRFAVADGLATLKDTGAITFGRGAPDRFAGEVHVPSVDALKDQAFAGILEDILECTIRLPLSKTYGNEDPWSSAGFSGRVGGLPARSQRRTGRPRAAGEQRPRASSRPWKFRSGRVSSEGNSPLFDGYVVSNWSAGSKQAYGSNSVWVAVCDEDGPVEVENLSTRQNAMNFISTLLDEAATGGGRLLCGFDFPFGYPKGAAQVLVGRDGWEAVWALIASVIEDNPDNTNNRFDAAAVLNSQFVDNGPFWGNGLAREVPGLTRKRPQGGWGETLPPRLRYAEAQIPRAQEVWKLWGAGSIGGQTLTGIARLEQLRQARSDVQVWPFETLGEGRAHLLAEIYRSLIDPSPGNETLDARQVRAVALTLREMDRSGQLEQYLRAPATMPSHVRLEEGAILGMHDPEGFRVAAQKALSHRVD